jgi:hypothetical protein
MICFLNYIDKDEQYRWKQLFWLTAGKIVHEHLHKTRLLDFETVFRSYIHEEIKKRGIK